MTTQELETGRQFGKYRIVRSVGEGAFGKVYEAVLPGPMGFTKRVAIKRIHTYLVEEDPKFVQSMVNEARIGGLLHHANIVDILEFGQAEDDWYIAMEFVDGISLAEVLDLCRRRTVLLPRFSAIEVALQVCRALQYAHGFCDPNGQALNLVHRDIKPSNVMLDATGTVKLCDFGIAKATTNLYMTTASATIKGTPRYMSPEQITAADELDARSDVFSLGAVLFEVMTGRVLYPETSLAALLHAILYDDLGERLDEAEVAFPGCRPLLTRALARNREDRYPDMLAMVEDLRTLDRTYPAEAEMSQVVRHLLEAVEQSEARAVETPQEQTVSMQEAIREVRGGARNATPAYLPSVPVAIEPPSPNSSGWGEFTAAFFDSEPGEAVGRVEPTARSERPRPRAQAEIPSAARLSGADEPSEPSEPDPSFSAAQTVPLLTPLARAVPDEGEQVVPTAGSRRGLTLWIVAGVGVLLGLILLVARPWDRPTGTATPAEQGTVPTPAEVTPAADPAEETTEEPAEETAEETTEEPAVEVAPPPVEEAEPVDPAEAAGIEPSPTANLAPGSISLSVTPWADIYVDGERVTSGNALREYPVEGGVHEVKAICSAVEYRTKVYTVTVDGEGVMLGCWDFEAMAACSRTR